MSNLNEFIDQLEFKFCGKAEFNNGNISYPCLSEITSSLILFCKVDKENITKLLYLSSTYFPNNNRGKTLFNGQHNSKEDAGYKRKLEFIDNNDSVFIYTKKLSIFSRDELKIAKKKLLKSLKENGHCKLNIR